MNSFSDFMTKFFGVAIKGQTYLNNLYLFLAFPLGLFYFVFLVTGLAVSVSLIIVWVGLLFLLVMFASWFGLAAFERQMTIWLLHEEIPPMVREDLSQKTTWQKFTATLRNPVTWKGLAYLLAKFPLGVFSFVVQVTLVSVSLSLIAAPLYYRFASPYVQLSLLDIIRIDTLPEAILACFIGILLALASMHVLNGLAWISGKFARLMLGNYSTPAAAAAGAATVSAAVPAPAAPAMAAAVEPAPAPAFEPALVVAEVAEVSAAENAEQIELSEQIELAEEIEQVQPVDTQAEESSKSDS